MTGAGLYDSVSEGCYLILPQISTKEKRVDTRKTIVQKKRGTNKDNTVSNSPPNLELDGFRRLFCDSEPEECLKFRHMMCQRAIAELESRVKALVLEINQNTLSRLAAFVEHAHPQLDPSDESDGFSSICPSSLPFNEIPTALVFAGVNIPDHDVLFRQISKHIRSRTNHPVAVLESKDCNSLRNMMKNMISQFLGNCDLDDEDGEEHEDDDAEGGGNVVSDANQQTQSTYAINTGNIRSCKTPPYDLQILEGWYAQQIELRIKESQDGNRCTKRQNLVVIIQDFECFSPDVLEDFITICSSYYPRLPFTLFIGIATSIEAMHQMLPQAALSLLRTEKFGLSNAEGGVGALVDEFLVKPTAGLKMSFRTYKMLSENFFLHNMSLTSFVRNIKYALMDHFYAEPLSILSSAITEKTDQVQKMVTTDHLECVRMQKSFICYVEGLVIDDPTEARQLVSSDDHLRLRLPNFIRRLQEYHENFAFAFDVLDAMQKNVSQTMNTTSLKKARRTLYLYALDRSMVETDFFQSMVNMLRKMDVQNFISLMTQCGQMLQNFTPAREDSKSINVNELNRDSAREEGSLNPHITTWNALQMTIEQLQTLLKHEEGSMSTEHPVNENAESSDEEESKTNRITPRKRSRSPSDDETGRRFTRRKLANQKNEEVLAAFKRKSETEAEYAKVVDVAVKLWEEFFRRNMPHYTTIPLHELNYYNHTRLLSRAFNAQPRAAIQTALGHPSHYLDCDCCQTEGRSDGALHPTLPDATIAYRIYLESSRMINMYDWFVAFGMVLEREKRKVDFKATGPQKVSERRGIGKTGKKRQAEEERINCEQEEEEEEGKKFQQEVQSRFIRAVAELQFLGFIRPTNRKTDHFIRCTWGDM